MELNDFKDWLFKELYELDNDILVDIDANKKKSIFYLRMIDGSKIEIECHKK